MYGYECSKCVTLLNRRFTMLSSEVRHFLGEWLDNLGHKIVVSSVSERLGRNQRPGRRDTQGHPEGTGLMSERL